MIVLLFALCPRNLPLAFRNGHANGAEIVVGQDDVCCFLGDIGAFLSHSNTNVSTFESKRDL